MGLIRVCDICCEESEDSYQKAVVWFWEGKKKVYICESHANDAKETGARLHPVTLKADKEQATFKLPCPFPECESYATANVPEVAMSILERHLFKFHKKQNVLEKYVQLYSRLRFRGADLPYEPVEMSCPISTCKKVLEPSPDSKMDRYSDVETKVENHLVRCHDKRDISAELIACRELMNDGKYPEVDN